MVSHVPSLMALLLSYDSTIRVGEQVRPFPYVSSIIVSRTAAEVLFLWRHVTLMKTPILQGVTPPESFLSAHMRSCCVPVLCVCTSVLPR